MKIVYFLDFPYNVGGSNKVLLTQAYIMSKRGRKTLIVIPNYEGRHSSKYDRLCNRYGLDTRTAEFSVASCMEEIDILSVFKDYDEIFRLLKREKADLIHSTQLNITVEMASRELGIPHLMNIYQTDLEAFHMKWMEIYPLYHSADSELFSKRWQKGLGISSRCIRVAYENNTGDVIKKTTDRMPLRLLCIGGVGERKNQLEIIKFVLICKKNGIQVTLTILGDDNTVYGKVCKDFVKQQKLEGEVFFQGFVFHIEDYFKQADLMIMASTVESYPGVIVESMANKVPVLSTPVAGVPELLKDGYNAFLTNGYHAENLYGTFKRYLSYKNKGRLQAVIDCAYETYQQNHSYESIGAELEDYYKWILKDYTKKSLQIGIKDVRKEFEAFMNSHCLLDKDVHTKNSLWFLFHLEKRIRAGRFQRVAVWGAGLFGKKALEWVEILDCRERFVGFIDTLKKGSYLGYPILDADKETILSCDMILAAVGNINDCLEIMKCLDGLGKKRNIDYYMMLKGVLRI